MTQSIAYTGLTISPPLFVLTPVLESALTEVLHDKLAAGLLLHFEHFAATGLTLVPDGSPLGPFLSLAGTPSPFCSPTPPPEPPTPPTRGLVRVLPTLGAGELIGEFGDVIPFELIPEVGVDWEDAAGFFSFQSLRPIEPSTGLYRPLASEVHAPASNIRGLRLSAELIRRVPSNCFRKPLNLTDALAPAFPPGATQGRPGGGCPPDLCGCTICVPGAAFFLEVTKSDGSTLITRDPAVLGSTHLGYPSQSRDADFTTEVAPLLQRIDGPLCPGPNCPRNCTAGRCQPWTRLQLPFSPGNGVPFAIALWAGPSLQPRIHDLLPIQGPQQPCGAAQKYQRIVGERILTPASVTFGPMMVDSAELSSARLGPQRDWRGREYFTGIADTQSSPAFVRTHGAILSDLVTKIEFTTACTAHPLGQPHLSSPCWRERVDLPELGDVYVTNGGHSDTVPPRVPLSTAFDPAFTSTTVADYGARRAAVQGTLDRSALRVFTEVPAVYRSIGLTTALLDYRGRVFLDWQHDSTFPAPGGSQFRHLKAGTESAPGPRPRWGGLRTREYFANWRTDRFFFIHVPDAPASFCVWDEDKFALPGDIEFRGARLPREVTVPASQYLLNLPGIDTPVGAFPGPFP